MCDKRQCCLGGALHYSKESSLHSCSVCGNLGDELLEHWLSSQQKMENNQTLICSTCSTSPGCGRGAQPGCWGGRVWLAGLCCLQKLSGSSSEQKHSGPRAGQRLSHPPGFPGLPRAMDGTGSPALSGSTSEPGGDSPLAQQNLGAREGFLLHRLRPSSLHILDRFMEGSQHPQPAAAAHHTTAAKCPAE